MSIVNCISGLENIGNTCYLNVIIQLLNNIQELRDYSFNTQLKKKISSNKKKDNILTISFLELLKSLNRETKVEKPLRFKEILGQVNDIYEGYDQHDCCEVLMYIIDNIHVNLSHKVKISYSGTPKNLRDRLMIQSLEAWNNTFKNEYSNIVPLLFGQNKLTMKNKKNKNEYLFDSYNVLTLSINNCNSLYECFFKLIEKESLTDHNDYNSKYERLWKLPKYLFIQLKRFEGTSKLRNLINFPIDNFDLSDFCDSYEKLNCKYNLIGVANHHGRNNFGHYTCFIKDEGSWYLFDDDDRSLVKDKEEVISNDAYLLLYQKII